MVLRAIGWRCPICSKSSATLTSGSFRPKRSRRRSPNYRNCWKKCFHRELQRFVRLEFVSYYIDPSISQEEACRRNLTWSSPVITCLINRKTSEIKEEEIYLGDFPS